MSINPYIFTLLENSTLTVEIAYGGDREVAVQLFDETLVARGLWESRVILYPPCLPRIQDIPVGHMWGNNQCSPFCPPPTFRFVNSDNFAHAFRLVPLHKNFHCDDGTRFSVGFDKDTAGKVLELSQDGRSVKIQYNPPFTPSREHPNPDSVGVIRLTMEGSGRFPNGEEPLFSHLSDGGRKHLHDELERAEEIRRSRPKYN